MHPQHPDHSASSRKTVRRPAPRLPPSFNRRLKFRSTRTIISQFTAVATTAVAPAAALLSAKSLHHVAKDWIAACRKMIELSIEVGPNFQPSLNFPPALSRYIHTHIRIRAHVYIYTLIEKRERTNFNVRCGVGEGTRNEA